MRLVKVNSDPLEVVEFMDEKKIQPYAILSHTWGKEECSLQDMTSPDVKSRLGYRKIQYTCDQARKEGLDWAWVDTLVLSRVRGRPLACACLTLF